MESKLWLPFSQTCSVGFKKQPLTMNASVVYIAPRAAERRKSRKKSKKLKSKPCPFASGSHHLLGASQAGILRHTRCLPWTRGELKRLTQSAIWSEACNHRAYGRGNGVTTVAQMSACLDVVFRFSSSLVSPAFVCGQLWTTKGRTDQCSSV